MKTKEEVQEEYLVETVFDIDEFVEMLDDGTIDPFDPNPSGYYHDGEEESAEPVWLNRQDILDHKEKYPYIIWKDI